MTRPIVAVAIVLVVFAPVAHAEPAAQTRGAQILRAVAASWQARRALFKLHGSRSVRAYATKKLLGVIPVKRTLSAYDALQRLSEQKPVQLQRIFTPSRYSSWEGHTVPTHDRKVGSASTVNSLDQLGRWFDMTGAPHLGAER